MRKSVSCPSFTDMSSPSNTNNQVSTIMHNIPKKKRSTSTLVRSYNTDILPYFYTSLHNASTCILAEKDTNGTNGTNGTNNTNEKTSYLLDLAHCIASPPEVVDEEDHGHDFRNNLLRLRHAYHFSRSRRRSKKIENGEERI